MAVPSVRRRIGLDAGGGQAARVALVEQRGDLVGVELGLRLRRRRRPARRQALGAPWTASASSCFLQLVGDRIGLLLRPSAPAAWRRRPWPLLVGLRSAASAPAAARGGSGGGGRLDRRLLGGGVRACAASAGPCGIGSAFFSTSGLGLSTGLGASFTPLVSWEKSFSLMKSTGSDFDRGRLERLARKRHRRPHEHRRVQAGRNRCRLLHLHQRAFEPCSPCSNSVTKATRWKPAADSWPITFIIVP